MDESDQPTKIDPHPRGGVPYSAAWGYLSDMGESLGIGEPASFVFLAGRSQARPGRGERFGVGLAEQALPQAMEALNAALRGVASHSGEQNYNAAADVAQRVNPAAMLAA
jgi:hypothetical protein